MLQTSIMSPLNHLFSKLKHPSPGAGNTQPAGWIWTMEFWWYSSSRGLTQTCAGQQGPVPTPCPGSREKWKQEKVAAAVAAGYEYKPTWDWSQIVLAHNSKTLLTTTLTYLISPHMEAPPVMLIIFVAFSVLFLVLLYFFWSVWTKAPLWLYTGWCSKAGLWSSLCRYHQRQLFRGELSGLED